MRNRLRKGACFSAAFASGTALASGRDVHRCQTRGTGTVTLSRHGDLEHDLGEGGPR